MSTINTKAKEVVRKWHIIDLKGQTLGRVSTKIANLLSGKDKVNYSPNLDMGDYVVALNSDGIKVTGDKLETKIYYRHSGFPGGFRSIALGDLMAKDSRRVIEMSVKGMLGKNKLQQTKLKRLKIFKNETHPYASRFTLPKEK